jgi:hypothetical protein
VDVRAFVGHVALDAHNPVERACSGIDLVAILASPFSNGFPRGCFFFISSSFALF